MADALKKGIAAKFLLPMVGAYVGAAAALSLSAPVDLAARLAPFVGAAGVMGLLALVVEEAVPRSLKEVVVFWRRTHRPPGYRAFSKIAPADGRVDPDVLKSLLPAAPLTPEQENQTWYKWLKETESDPGVSQNHRNFLILRDAAVLAAGLAGLTPALILPDASGWPRALTLEAVCLGLYLVLMISARNSACRLVGNVIALKVAKAGASPATPKRGKAGAGKKKAG